MNNQNLVFLTSISNVFHNPMFEFMLQLLKFKKPKVGIKDVQF